MYIFYSFNKPYLNYDREKPRERQCNIVSQHCNNYNNYMKRLLNNKSDNKNKEKNRNKHHSECRLKHCPKHRFEYCKRKWDQ